MKITTAEFITSGTQPKHFPDSSYPEFAFLGRSNVGKSSLMNMVMGRKNLVKTGAKPGVTKTINFFLVNNAISMVDLPGFGYAKLPDALRKTFMPMITGYLSNRKNLKMAFLLVDGRRVPGSFEKDILDTCMKAGVPAALVITKTDKLSKSDMVKNKKKILKELDVPEESVIVTSSHNGTGKQELHSAISSMIG